MSIPPDNPRPAQSRKVEVPASPAVKAGGGALGALGWLAGGWLGIYRRLEGLPLALFLGTNLCGVCVCALMVIGLFSDREGDAVAVGAATATGAPAATSTRAPSATAPTTPTEAPATSTPEATASAPVAPSDEGLTAWGRARYGDNFRKAELAVDIAVIDYALPDLWDEGLMIAAVDDLRAVAPELFGLGPQVQAVRLRPMTGFVDQSGATSEEFALGLFMPRIAFEKITWEGMTSRRLAALMDSEADGATAYVHPALREAWAGYAGE